MKFRIWRLHMTLQGYLSLFSAQSDINHSLYEAEIQCHQISEKRFIIKIHILHIPNITVIMIQYVY
jgi:hypothetical protein